MIFQWTPGSRELTIFEKLSIFNVFGSLGYNSEIEYHSKWAKKSFKDVNFQEVLLVTVVSILLNITYMSEILGLLKSNAQKMKLSIKDFVNKCDQIRRKLRIWSYLLKKSLMKNFIFCVV